MEFGIESARRFLQDACAGLAPLLAFLDAKVSDTLQLWDFLHCFRSLLAEAGFAPKRHPSLKRLAKALNTVEQSPNAVDT